jgi:xanthine/uracil permease
VQCLFQWCSSNGPNGIGLDRYGRDGVESGGEPGQPALRYGLDARLRTPELISYSLQSLTYFLANAAILPVVVGGYLGLDPAGIGSLVQRTFILCGVASILQVLWGHRLPLMEGPAGLWYGVLITLALSAPSLGKPLALLRTDIELGFLVAGAVCIFLGVTGIVVRIAAIFSPLVNGIFLILVSLQISPAMMKGMLGLTAENHTAEPKVLLAFVVTTGLILWITLRGRGFLQSLAVLLGAAAGWLMAVFLGITQGAPQYREGMSSAPGIFAWGTPTFDGGVVLTFVLSAVLLFSNLIASVDGMSSLTGEPRTPRLFKRAAAFTGVADIIAGVGAVVGFVPYASSIGFVAMTGVAARKPFILGSVFLILLGIFPQVGAFFASMPTTVGNAVMFVVFALILGIGVREFTKTRLENREMCIIGSSLLVAMGVMFLPPQVFDALPAVLRYLLLNGLVVGVLMAILLEQIMPARKRALR